MFLVAGAVWIAQIQLLVDGGVVNDAGPRTCCQPLYDFVGGGDGGRQN